MQTMTVNDILQSISVLPPEDQYFIAETLSRRICDLKRHFLAARAEEAEENYKAGRVSGGSVADLMKAVNDD
ncbi:MAG: hypothetical protein R2941_22605 [Desulfobacterales bacterium]